MYSKSEFANILQERETEYMKTEGIKYINKIWKYLQNLKRWGEIIQPTHTRPRSQPNEAGICLENFVQKMYSHKCKIEALLFSH